MNIETEHKRRTATPDIEIRMATIDDVPKLCRLFGYFYEDSRWFGIIHYQPAKALRHLRYAIENGAYIYIVAFDGDQMVGVISYSIFQAMCDPIAVMEETYLLKPYRRTDLGLKMVMLAMEVAKKSDNCKIFNFPLCSGMQETQSYTNMLAKHFDAKPVGVVMSVVLTGENDGR